jgi:hypothetical protein
MALKQAGVEGLVAAVVWPAWRAGQGIVRCDGGGGMVAV